MRNELLNDAKKYANELRDFFVDELNIHRNSGNFKYELTPKDVSNAFMKGVTYILDKLNVE